MLEFLKTRSTSSLILLIAFFFFFGIFIGVTSRPDIDKIASLANKDNEVISKTDFAPFWKAWNSIDKKAQNAKEATDQERVYGAIQGLVSSLDDPYSVFFPPAEAKAFSEEIAGNFTGVGMEVGVKNKILTVVAPLKDTPAERAGILSGDQILKIDELVTSGMSTDEAIKLIRGEKGTPVVLTIFREGLKEPKEITIIRDVINVPTLDTEIREDGIFVVKLYSFSANASDLFKQAMREFMQSNSNKLILDLRSNPGGYLDAAVDIASWFIESGKVIVTEDYGENQKPKIFRSRGYKIYKDNFKFVILINGGSASASEIVAGAVQDTGKAKLVGEQSFGKGSVQEVVDLTKDTLLKLTVAKWLTPNGGMIHGKGLTPDYEIELTREDIENKKDPQMDKAVELLNK